MTEPDTEDFLAAEIVLGLFVLGLFAVIAAGGAVAFALWKLSQWVLA